MHLYSLTLKRASAVSRVAAGNFSSPSFNEFVVAKGRMLELLRPDAASGRLISVTKADTFGLIRSICAFRLHGGKQDYVVVTSDSGVLVVLSYSAELRTFVRVHSEVYGKTGVRRLVPSQVGWLVGGEGGVAGAGRFFLLPFAVVRCGAMRCGVVRCGAVRCGAMRSGASDWEGRLRRRWDH